MRIFVFNLEILTNLFNGELSTEVQRTEIGALHIFTQNRSMFFFARYKIQTRPNRC